MTLVEDDPFKMQLMLEQPFLRPKVGKKIAKSSDFERLQGNWPSFFFLGGGGGLGGTPRVFL